MPKKKLTKKSNFQFFALSNILVVITTIALAVTTYFFIENQKLTEQNIETSKQLTKIKHENKILHKQEEEQRAKYFEEKTKALDIEYSNNIDNEEYITQQKPKQTFTYKDLQTIKDTVYKKVEDIVEQKEPIEKPKPIITQTKQNKPKLAIIIDDVTTSYQRDKILNIGYTVNMAFLPPTPRHRSSAKIASSLDYYMVHLPLQASSNKYDEENTLYINDTYTTIEKRIMTLQQLYPKAKFINNHTGSKFTQNQQAMDKLFQVLKKYNYTFVDSKTTAKSVAKLSGKKYGLRTLSRNIFLDNKKDKKYIQKQLKKAIKIAKKNGSAIAIGHPYNITFETLKDSKYLLDEIDMVYVHQL